MQKSIESFRKFVCLYIRGVANSYQRVGWGYSVPKSYVEEHLEWSKIAQLDLAFEDIISKPRQQIQKMETWP